MSCFYRAYDHGELVLTGRMTLDRLPSVGDQVPLNGRPFVVRSVDYVGGEPVLALDAPS